MSGWIGVDLDGTLAEYHGWPSDGSIGKPVQGMVELVKLWIAEGRDVRIFTARVWPLGTDRCNIPQHADRADDAMRQSGLIKDWCLHNLGAVLPVTCVKDYSMI